MIIGRARDYGDVDMPSASAVAAVAMGSADGLVRWATSLVRRGEDPIVYRDATARIGTAIHTAILLEVATTQGVDEASEAILAELEKEHRGFLSMATRTETETVERGGVQGTARMRRYFEEGWHVHSAEMPLVSVVHDITGTYDYLLRRGGEWLIVDIKTASFLTGGGNLKRTIFKSTHAVQLGIYATILEAIEDNEVTEVGSGDIVYVSRDSEHAPIVCTVEDTPNSRAWTSTKEAAQSAIYMTHYTRRAEKVLGRQCAPKKQRKTKKEESNETQRIQRRRF